FRLGPSGGWRRRPVRCVSPPWRVTTPAGVVAPCARAAGAIHAHARCSRTEPRRGPNMLQLLTNTNIPFMRFRRFAYMFSGLISAATIVCLVTKAPRSSAAFPGGPLLQIRLSQPLPADQVRAALDQGGYRGVELQQMNAEGRSEFLLRIGQAQAATQTDLFGQ